MDVTDICLDQLTKNNIIYIPSGDCNRGVILRIQYLVLRNV